MLGFSSSPLLIYYLIFFFFILLCLINNLIIHWFIFLVISFIIVTLIFFSSSPPLLIINYFILQELLSVLFIINISYTLQFTLLFFKLGVPPFYFWVLYFLRFLGGFLIIWFLFWSNFVYVPFFIIFTSSVHYIILLGLFLIYYHIFCSTSSLLLLFLSSIESFLWLLLILEFSHLNFIFLFTTYILLILFLFNSGYNYQNVSLWSLFFFLSFPFNNVFMVKLCGLCQSSFLLLVIFLFFFISFISTTSLMFEILIYTHSSPSSHSTNIYYLLSLFLFFYSLI